MRQGSLTAPGQNYMNRIFDMEWEQANQRYLMSCESVRLRADVWKALRALKEKDAQTEDNRIDATISYATSRTMSAPPAWTMCYSVYLSTFERNIILLSGNRNGFHVFSVLCFGTWRSQRNIPDFGLALTGNSGAHWKRFGARSAICVFGGSLK